MPETIDGAEATSTAVAVEVPSGFNQVMGAGSSWKRLVGKTDLWEGPETHFYNIRPWRSTMNQNSFNMVLSLCDDGKQREALDWDQKGYPHRRDLVEIPSTNNLHLYGLQGMTFHAYRETVDILRREGAVQTGIYNQLCRLGFTVLRAPWEKKPPKHDEKLAKLLQLRREARRIDNETLPGPSSRSPRMPTQMSAAARAIAFPQEYLAIDDSRDFTREFRNSVRALTVDDNWAVFGGDDLY